MDMLIRAPVQKEKKNENFTLKVTNFELLRS